MFEQVATRRARPRARRAGLPVVLLAVAAVLASCGGGSDDPTVLRAGQIDIKLPPGFKVVGGKVVAPGGSVASSPQGPSGTAPATTGSTKTGSAKTGSATATTTKSGTSIPLASSDNPQTALFTAFGKFRGCLDRDGVKFIGGPDQSNPSSPTNDPNYLKALSKCAAESNIVSALQAAQTAQDNLTPAQIKQENEAYLKWRSCMIGRGWKIPEPTPDAKGRLFSFGTGSSGSGGRSASQSPLQPPAGKDALTSPDIQQCAAKAQKSAPQSKKK